MLPKQYRLPSYLIPKILKEGRRVYSPNFRFMIKEDGETGVAILVGKSIRKAVARNRVKRLTREAVKLLIPSFKKTFSVLVFPKEAIAEKKMTEVEKEIRDAFKKAGVL